MSDQTASAFRRRAALPLLLICLVALGPALAFAVGSLLAPYEGDHGLAGFFGAIGADALRGEPVAWILLLSPTLVVALWWLLFRLVWPRRASDAQSPSD